MLVVGHVNTDGGMKWKCLVLDVNAIWSFAFPLGSVVLFRDIDFTERIA